MSHAQANPFSGRSVLAVVLTGAALFLALLWMIGTGTGFGSANDGKAHAEGRGLNGYAAMVEYLGRRGYTVSTARNEADLDPEGLLVLTPPAGADPDEINRIISAHRYDGATLVILPKWWANPVTDRQKAKGGKEGWVNLSGAAPPNWASMIEGAAARKQGTTTRKRPDGTIENADDGSPWRWDGLGVSGQLPDPFHVQMSDGGPVVPLVVDDYEFVLAGLLDDGGSYPEIWKLAKGSPHRKAEDEDKYPLVFVYEPDLLDNYGMASASSARLLDALIPLLEVKKGGPIVFDLTLNGFGQARNLLSLAVTPPFLGVSLCLLLAAILVGWRAFVRFGPAAVPERALAFGKEALVANSAGLITRARRFHLLRVPYADRTRERLVRVLALPRALDADGAEAAIDRALASRAPDAEPFSRVAARLRSARKPHEILKAARDLHALERTLTQ